MRRAPGIRSFRPSAAAGMVALDDSAAVVLLLTLGLYVRRISAPKQIAEETTQAVVSDLAVAGLNTPIYCRKSRLSQQ